MQTQGMIIDRRMSGAFGAGRAVAPARILLSLDLIALDLLGLRLIRP